MGSIIIFHLSKLWKAKFSILCDVIFHGEGVGEIWCLSLLGVKGLKLSCSTVINSPSFANNGIPSCALRISDQLCFIWTPPRLTFSHPFLQNTSARQERKIEVQDTLRETQPESFVRLQVRRGRPVGGGFEIESSGNHAVGPRPRFQWRVPGRCPFGPGHEL